MLTEGNIRGILPNIEVSKLEYGQRPQSHDRKRAVIKTCGTLKATGLGDGLKSLSKGHGRKCPENKKNSWNYEREQTNVELRLLTVEAKMILMV